MWRTDQLADAVAEALAARERSLRDEQAVHGLDSLDEVGLHPVLAAAFVAAGFGVLRERPYPSEWLRKRRLAVAERIDRATGEVVEEVLPDRRDRLRCDLVLTPAPGEDLGDQWTDQREASRHRKKAERAARKAAAGDLFESLAALEQPPPRTGLDPREAFWLEVKLVAQFCYTAGVPGPNRAYASELTRNPASDLTKLACDDLITSAGTLLIHFAADRATADHDLTRLLHRCLDRDLPIASPETRHVPILDRVGNGLCTVCLIGLRKQAATLDRAPP